MKDTDADAEREPDEQIDDERKAQIKRGVETIVKAMRDAYEFMRDCVLTVMRALDRVVRSGGSDCAESGSSSRDDCLPSHVRASRERLREQRERERRAVGRLDLDSL